MLLNPVLDALDVARRAAIDLIHSTDQVMLEDGGDHWVYEFVPQDDALGGGVRISIAKADLSILSIVRCQ